MAGTVVQAVPPSAPLLQPAPPWAPCTSTVTCDVPPGTTNVWFAPVEAKAVWNVSAYMASDALLEVK